MMKYGQKWLTGGQHRRHFTVITDKREPTLAGNFEATATWRFTNFVFCIVLLTKAFHTCLLFHEVFYIHFVATVGTVVGLIV